MFIYSFFGCSVIIALEKTHHCMQIMLTQVHGKWSTISLNGQIHKYGISCTFKYIVVDNQKYSFKINLCSYTLLDSLLKILAFA